MQRRSFLAAFLAGLASSVTAWRAMATSDRRLFLGTRRTQTGAFHVTAFGVDGVPRLDAPLPGRGHAFAVQPGGEEAVVFARRPGSYARVLDLFGGEVRHDFSAPKGRHFYGHGVFSPDGQLLYATENDFADARGVIGVYDARAGYGRLGEIPSHGVGPHDIRLLSDGVTLAVANGGIATHPDYPRVKMNLPTMAPSLVYLDRRDGRLLEDVRLASALHQLSIRHLAVGEGDVVALAMQDEGPAGTVTPLVALHRRGDAVQMLDAPNSVLRAMKRYCGSTAFDASGRIVGVSAPRGSVLAFWDVGDRRFLSSVQLGDGCGLAAEGRVGRFVASSGQGGAVIVDATSGTFRRLDGEVLARSHWDNHLRLVE